MQKWRLGSNKGYHAIRPVENEKSEEYISVVTAAGSLIGSAK